MKWLMAHYHACRAISMVRQLDRAVEKFNSVTYGRMNNFSIWLEAIASHVEQIASTGQCTKELADHLSNEIDRLESLIREASIDFGRIEGKLNGSISQMHNLAKAVELHNGAGKLLNSRMDDLERRFDAAQRMAKSRASIESSIN